MKSITLWHVYGCGSQNKKPLLPDEELCSAKYNLDNIGTFQVSFQSIEVCAMNLEEYRIECGWSRNELARQAGIDTNTLGRATNGVNISIATADKLTRAISKRIGRTIRFQDIEGLKVNL